ncbi:MAG TPA: peptide ABC transporter substrate-binding protein [Syntrophomonadaceae bacterium]|nr:peptide ABC transporter substrate-binding protein [Syntrophomonadaceae bacterium]
MSQKKVLAILLALTFVFSFVLAGCGGDQTADKEAEKVITYNLGASPETMDPAMSTGLPEATIQNALFEGLYRYGADKELQPAVAEKVDVSEDGLKYVFTIKKDVKWSNGDPVTAHDFEYSWKRLLDKETGAEYAYQAFYIKNGEEFNAGKVSADEVGVKATDDYTLEVELVAPTPYFLDLTAFANLFPLHEETVEGNENWAASPDTIVGNGPYKMTAFQAQEKVEMVKNENYWDTDNVNLDKLTMTFVEDENTELSMFESNQIDIAENVPVKDTQKLLADGKAISFPEAGCYYYIFNCKKAPFDDARVRKAFTYAIDRQAIIDNITQAGQKPALAYTPFGFPDETVDKDFRSVGGDYFKDNDVEKAKELLAEAGYPDGKGLPDIEIFYNTQEAHQKIAEAVGQMWKDNLGANVKLRNSEWAVYLSDRDEGNFQVARAGWMADYNDAMTYMDMHVTDGGNNDSFWSNAEYDELINEAKASNDEKLRIENMHKAEKILMDEMPVAPIYFYVNVNMYQPWVKGVFTPPFGSYQEFKWADVDQSKK